MNEVPDCELDTAQSHNIKAGVGISEFREFDADERVRRWLDYPLFEKIKRRPKKKKQD